jgi:hypothetical protein
MIGLGGSSGGDATGPSATFIPEPNVKYQIQPANTYYVTFGNYTEGVLIDVTKIGTTCKIDYTKQPMNVSIVHTEKGELVIQTE